jgi:thiaminase
MSNTNGVGQNEEPQVVVATDGEDYKKLVKAQAFEEIALAEMQELRRQRDEIQELYSKQVSIALKKSFEHERTITHLSNFMEDFRVRFEAGEVQEAMNIQMASYYCAASKHMEGLGRSNNISDKVQEWIDNPKS